MGSGKPNKTNKHVPLPTNLVRFQCVLESNVHVFGVTLISTHPHFLPNSKVPRSCCDSRQAAQFTLDLVAHTGPTWPWILGFLGLKQAVGLAVPCRNKPPEVCALGPQAIDITRAQGGAQPTGGFGDFQTRDVPGGDSAIIPVRP